MMTNTNTDYLELNSIAYLKQRTRKALEQLSKNQVVDGEAFFAELLAGKFDKNTARLKKQE